jgi:hypothetical protein
VALVEQPRQSPPKRRELIEEADSADADAPVPPAAQAADEIGAVEHGRLVGGGFAAGEAEGERPWVPPGAGGRGEETGEEGGVGGEGEGARGVPPLPTAGGEDGGQVGRAADRVQLGGNVVAQGVQRDEQDIVGANQSAYFQHTGLNDDWVG